MSTNRNVSKVSNTLSRMETTIESNAGLLEVIRNTMVFIPITHFDVAYGSQMQQNQLIRRLMMKPAALAQALSNISQQSSVSLEMEDDKDDPVSQDSSKKSPLITASNTYRRKTLSNFNCTCHLRSRYTTWWSPFDALGMGNFSITRYGKDCPSFNTEKCIQVAMQYGFPRYLLSKAMTLSLSISHGASGCSVAPYLGIISVAVKESPAFHMSITNDLGFCLPYDFSRRIDSKVSSAFLRWLFIPI